MINQIKFILQIIAISSFGGLTFIGFVEKQWDYGVGLNLSLVFLYLFLYLHPFSK